MVSFLNKFLEEFATSIVLADRKNPQKISRTGRVYQHGIGPHTEDETVDLALSEFPKEKWKDCRLTRAVPYPLDKKKKCDLSLTSSTGKLFIEIKMMRLFGDNGKTNDNITMHILSPYPQQRSALTDIQKLKESGFDGERAIVIYGYDYDDYPLTTMIDCFEKLAAGDLHTPGAHFEFDQLVHPIHKRGSVYGWMIKTGETS